MLNKMMAESDFNADDSMIKEGERIDDLQCKGYRLIQKPEGFCFGIDAVLLSDFVNVKPGQSVLDLCTGSGVIPILLAAKTEGKHFTGLELQEEYADMASRSVKLNHLEERVDIICGDVKAGREIFSHASFQVVTVNPPYMTDHHGLLNLYEPKTIARHEVTVSLEDVISLSSYVLPQSGNFFMIHKPFRLAEIFCVMKKYHIEPKRMRLIHPYVDKEPTMVMIHGLKGGKQRITVEPPLIVYKDRNVYSDEISRIYGK
jgi:tRNA1(Val) A37 N6-methylase TrmN6